MPELEVIVFENRQERCKHVFGSAVEVGRQRRASEPIYTPLALPEGNRLVVAETSEDNVGRQHAQIEPLDPDRARVKNLSSVQPIYFENPTGPPLMPGEKRDVGLPQLIRLGTSRILRLQKPSKNDASTASLGGATMPPGVSRSGIARFTRPTPDDVLRPEDVLEWFAAVVGVLQSDPATSKDFFNRAATAVVELVDLDVGRVLFLEGGVWIERAADVSPKSFSRPSRPFSQTLLQKVREQKRTLWEAPAASAAAPASMLGLESVVAAPILSRNGEVLGALYGEREPRLTPGPGGGPITKLEATLVELLALSVAAGLARVEEEKKASGAITLFEQFFGPALARFLAQTPDWEKARQAEVTLLFCDIKGFTRISGKLKPEQTYEWVNDVLNMLSQCVLENEGVLVDYVGDEVMSLWGAPRSRDDHARAACQAALDMLAGLPAINKKWAPIFREHGIDEVTDLAVGLNSGTAQVGNVGSRFKFKYGAQGPTVNIASRVMNANKFFKARVLLTGHTHEQPGVKDVLHCRRLGLVRLNNVKDDLEMYELVAQGSVEWPAWRDEYHNAMKHFESVVADGPNRTAKDDGAAAFGTAGQILANWRIQHRDDPPPLVLLSRVVNALVDGPAPDHPVWVFKEK